jgi:hypothetical protein
MCPMDNLIPFVVYKGTHITNLTIASNPSVEGLNALTPDIYLLQDVDTAGQHYVYFNLLAPQFYI